MQILQEFEYKVVKINFEIKWPTKIILRHSLIIIIQSLELILISHSSGNNNHEMVFGDLDHWDSQQCFHNSSIHYVS